MAKQKFTLGRGLDALISTEAVRTSGSSSIGEIEIEKIFANPNQPRRDFNEEALQELADSIRELGVIQPITLRKMDDGTYQIIAGERRFRASQIAGKTTIPAYILKADDEDTMEMALIENIQREDLNPLEIALAYQQLIEQHNLSQEQLSKRVGKGRATIANFLRLLKLPATIQVALKEKRIDMGHAKALLSLDSHTDQINIFHDIEKNSYSVREVEEMVRKVKEGEENQPTDVSKSNANKKQDAVYHQLKKHLTQFFQTPVQLTCSEKGSGKISIKFKNEKELERIITIFDKLNK
jgi:ParB family chromosome partitioning protein